MIIELPVVAQTAMQPAPSRTFMTVARYARLKERRGKPLIVAAPIFRDAALCEYLPQVPAKRTGCGRLSLPRLEITQGAIPLAAFVRFALSNLQQPLKPDYLRAAVCIMGAVYFIFRA